MMDRGRPKIDPSPSPSTSTSRPPITSKSPSSRQYVPPPKIETVKRKPVPPSASPLIGRVPPLSSGGVVVAVGEDNLGDYNAADRNPQSFLQDPPTFPPPNVASPPLQVRDLDQWVSHSSQTDPTLNHVSPRFPRGYSPRGPPQSEYFPPLNTENRQPSPRPQRARQASESRLHEATRAKVVPNNLGLQRAMSLHPSNRPTNTDYESSDPTVITKTPRSPGPNKLTSFFGWKTSSPIAEVSPTTYSEGSHSPALPSPLSPSPHSITSSSKSIPRTTEVPKENGNMGTQYFPGTGFPVPPGADGTGQFNDVDEELREVSMELAGSIRRELELEDLVDQLRLEASQGPDLGRRTSDYFSDSGSGSYRYPMSDAGAGKGDDLAKLRRISEQEKAQFKVNLTQKLQDERDQRKALENHVQQLGKQMANMDEERGLYSSVVTKVQDLEASLEDHRRRLQEERRAKTNFEDLLTALRGEFSQHRDERDNLRDEVVPQLKARVEGLEGEAAEHQDLTYEYARMQQELQSLKNENTTLITNRRLQQETQNHSPQFGSIAEEVVPSDMQGSGTGLSRSGSVAGQRGGLTRAPTMKRSNSVSTKERESRESLADRVKDIELQRDALHRALKSLLERQNYQKNEHEKKVRNLEIERDRALQNQSPRRTGYEKEVTSLRFEINQLRRRAEDASMQKYHIEKGLGGLKKDLDRAEQETSSLRKVLQEHDILIPEMSDRSSPDATTGSHATSASLERAYRDLQVTQAMSITKIRELHRGAPSSAEDADTAATMDRLLKSMNDAEAERDYAKKQAAIFRAQAESLMEADSFHTGENVGLVNQLRASADRVEALSSQVRLQLESNASLRQRLAEAVGRGEEAQKNSTTRINSMQGKLKNLEDKLMNAQQHSEEAFAQHEEEVREIRESHNQQLQRLKTGLKTPTVFSLANSPSSPKAMFGGRSPKLDRTTTGLGISLDEALKTEFLEKRVAELERALGEADREMEEVVGRMNQAQIEVMELQSARDEAMRQTRKLQAAINAERETVDKLMMK